MNILYRVSKQGQLPTPTDKKALYNKVYRLKAKLNKTQKNITLEELKELVEELSKKPDDPSEPYIMKSSIVTDEKTGKSRYSLILTSESLIEKTLKCDESWNLCLDATYQTNMEVSHLKILRLT